MKVLILDEDPNAQKILGALLQRNHCEAIICTDEAEGLRLVLEKDAPHIVLCDWKQPRPNAPEFSKKLRAEKTLIRPYLIILTTKSSKEEVAEGLDAGADDYIIKPFNLIEIQARLRVAKRSIEYQIALQNEADEARAISERNQLLAEMLRNQQSAKVPSIMQTAATAVSAVKQAAQANKIGEFGQYELRYMVSAALLELKLVLESTHQRLVPPQLSKAEFCAWSPILLQREGLWIDIILSGSLNDAATLFEKSLKRKPSGNSETLAFLAEITRIIAGAFMRTLQLKDPQTIAPLSTRALMPFLVGPMPGLGHANRSHDLCIEGKNLSLTIAHHACPCTEIEQANLRELDILEGPIPPHSVSETPQFHAGTLLTRRFVEKLREQSELTRFDYMASIRRPSSLARYFNNL